MGGLEERESEGKVDLRAKIGSMSSNSGAWTLAGKKPENWQQTEQDGINM